MKNLLKINVLLNKKLLFILAISFTLYSNAHNNPIFPKYYKAFFCDACGCSNNGGSLGMGGVLDTNFIGVRYLHQRYQSKDGIFNNSPKIDEYFNTVQIWSRIPVTEKLEVQAFIPIHFHSREYVNKSVTLNGLGDMSILTNYTFLNYSKSDYNEEKEKTYTINHKIKAGLGIKLPTGTYDEAINNAVNPSFQLGTGSVDYLTNLQYVFKYNRFGVTNYLNYYLKTTNNKEYKFGNQFNFNSTFFYVLKDKKERVFVPSIGFSGEFYGKNKLYNLDIKNTNGDVIFSNIGLEYNTKKITVGSSLMLPISQNLAQGAIDVKYRTTLYFNYNF